MKLTVRFPELAEQARRMGAPPSTWQPGAAALDPREELHIELDTGIEIDLDDVNPGPCGLLTYKGEQVLLYIRDTRSDLDTLLHHPEDSRRYHVAECRTLQRMRDEGRFERYVVTHRTNGLFQVDWVDFHTHERGETNAALKVCKNCLIALNWQGYAASHEEEIWRDFDITQFLFDYSTFFRTRPSRSDTEAVPNVYVRDWPKISEKTRRARGWTCEDCGVNLEQHRGLLHCHHISGVCTDNNDSNLKVLCQLCHAQQPGHGHLKVPTKNRLTIEQFRLKRS